MILYSEPSIYRPEGRLTKFARGSLGLGFPLVKEAPQDHHCLFNTITVTDYNKEG